MNREEWLERYYKHIGDEIGVAFNTINVNTGWALTLVSLLLSAIFLSGIFPDIRSFFVLLLVSLLLIRFFVRTTLGYQNLLRWNYLRNRIDMIFLGADKDGSIKTDLLKSIDLYDWNWFAPWPRGRLFLANLRYGYAAMFPLTYGLAVYAWLTLDRSTILSPSPDRSLAMAAVLVVTAFSLMEVKGLYDPFYFKHIESKSVTVDENSGRVKGPVRENKEPAVGQRALKHKKPLYAITVVLLCASAILLAWPITNVVMITNQDFPQTIRGFSLSNSLELVSGDKVSFEWYSTSPLIVVIAEMPAIQEFNKTGVLANVMGTYQGESGQATAVLSENVAIAILVSAQSVNSFTGQIHVQRVPHAALGTILGGISLIPLLAVVIAQAADLNRQEKQVEL